MTDKEYVYNQNSTFGIYYQGNTYWYNIKQNRDLPMFWIWFIKSTGEKIYLGEIYPEFEYGFMTNFNTCYTRESLVFENVFRQIWMNKFHIIRSTICPFCGKALRSKKSIERGYGQTCYERRNSNEHCES